MLQMMLWILLLQQQGQCGSKGLIGVADDAIDITAITAGTVRIKGLICVADAMDTTAPAAMIVRIKRVNWCCRCYGN